MWLVLGLAGILVTASGQTLYDTSPPAQSGEQVYGSYFDAGIDSIGLYNGNINIRINLITLPGRELTRGVSLSYNSQA